MPTLQSASRSIFPPCPRQRELGWYPPKQEQRNPGAQRTGIRAKHGATEKRQQDYREAFARLLPEDKAFLRQAKIAFNEPTLEARFREQSDRWQRETQHLSSPGQRTMHPSYLAIMGMAKDNPREVIKLMLRDIQQNRRPWFFALSYLAKDNPLKQSDAGKTDKMIKAWVNWGKAHRLL